MGIATCHEKQRMTIKNEPYIIWYHWINKEFELFFIGEWIVIDIGDCRCQQKNGILIKGSDKEIETALIVR